MYPSTQQNAGACSRLRRVPARVGSVPRDDAHVRLPAARAQARGVRPGAAICSALLLLLAGCQTLSPAPTPASPAAPWPVPAALQAEVVSVVADAGAGEGAPAGPTAVVGIDPDRTYGLPALIDIAQRNNPETRVAWESARQAAQAVGEANATLLPRLAASVVGGYQRVSTPIQLPLVGTRTLATDVQEVVPVLSLEWLLFDFGERAAAVRAARHLTTVANVEFNQVHQQLVFDVSQAYHAAVAAAQKRTAAERAMGAARQILAAAETGRARGVGTRVQVAQARQQLAQAQLSLTNARGEGEAAHVALNAVLGLPQATRVRLAAPGPLPAASTRALDQVIDAALAERADIIAAVAQLRAAEAGVDVAQAGFMPKVGVVGALARDDNRFRINNSPTLGTPLEQTGVLLGVTLPLTEGGLRRSRLRSAYARVRAAQAQVAAVRDAAAREIAAAYAALRTALAAHRSARAVVAASRVTVDAARKGLDVGLGTLTEAVAAEQALMEAEEVLADARRDAFDAATNLAFVTAALR